MKKPLTKFSSFIGATGIHADENLSARRTGFILEAPMLMAAVWILLNWSFNPNDSESQGHLYQGYDLWLWGFFILETLVLSLLVNDTRRYLRGNWLNLVIIVGGIPLLWQSDMYLGVLRLLRLLILVTLLVHLGGRVRTMLSSNELGATVIASLIVIVMAGVMMSALDPGIESATDGIWWAWVTITTVGYGDIVPESGVGKVVAGVIMLLGLGLFAMLTASFAAFFLRSREEKIISSEHEVHKRLTDIERQISTLDRKLDYLLDRPLDQHEADTSSKAASKNTE